MGKTVTVPSDADVDMLCEFLRQFRGDPIVGVEKFWRNDVRAALRNEPAFQEWDHVRAAWALLRRERTRMTKMLRQEAACQNGKDRDDAPYAAAVLKMVADELEATTVLASPPKPPKVTPLPATPAAPDKAHDEGADAPPTIQSVVTVLAHQALRAGTLEPDASKLLLAWLSAPKT